MKKTIAIVGVLVVIALVLMAGAKNMLHKSPVGPSVPTVPATIQAVFNGPNGTVSAMFEPGFVTFSYADLGTVKLPQVVSASGARYANTDESLVFWNKGNDVTIYKNNTPIFAGSVGGASSEVQTIPSATPKLPAGSPAPGTADMLRKGTWVWKSAQSAGVSLTPQKPDVFMITFSADGHVSGKTDCNSFSGTYQVGSDGVLTLGPLASTLMFCEGSQESQFTSLFSEMSRYVVSDSVLTLRKNDGLNSMVFVKMVQ